MAGTTWFTFTAGTKIRSSEVNSNFDWLEGSLAPMNGGSTTTAVHDLGSTTARWNNCYLATRTNITAPGVGDADILFQATTGSAWAVGVDNSDSDKFKISYATALGTNDYLQISTDGSLFNFKTSSGNNEIRIDTAAINQDAIISLYENAVAKWSIRNDGDASDGLLILSDTDTILFAQQGGNIGIRTASPLTNLHLKPSGGAAEIRIDTSAINLDSRLSLYENGVDKWAFSNIGATSDILRINSEIVSNVLTISQSGRLATGTTTAAVSAILDLNSTDGSLIVSRLTTTQRNALTAINGMMVYNSTDNQFNVYENGGWRVMGGIIGQTTRVVFAYTSVTFTDALNVTSAFGRLRNVFNYSNSGGMSVNNIFNVVTIDGTAFDTITAAGLATANLTSGAWEIVRTGNQTTNTTTTLFTSSSYTTGAHSHSVDLDTHFKTSLQIQTRMAGTVVGATQSSVEVIYERS